MELLKRGVIELSTLSGGIQPGNVFAYVPDISSYCARNGNGSVESLHDTSAAQYTCKDVAHVAIC
jgi:hypothetical protein